MLRAGTWHRGQPQVFGVDAPEPGREWFFIFPTVPEGVYWRIKSLQYRCVVSAVGTNRAFGLRIGAGEGDDYVRFFNALASVINLTVEHSFTEMAGGLVAANRPVVPTPNGVSEVGCSLPLDLRIQGGHQIRSATIRTIAAQNFLGPDAGDQFSGIRIYAEPYIYEPPGARSPEVGDGANRVDWEKLSSNLEKLATILKKE